MIVRLLKRLGADRAGATAVEYGLIAALIVMTMIAGLAQLGNSTTGMWGNINSKYENANRGN
uniref:Flp family type IVb pilin n=1 Tax=uncultured Sphingomonas sp. TaxID=158754 RepID=UPI0035CBA26B